MLERERWDLAVIVFPEVHWAMHLLWQTWDREHPGYDPAVRLPFQNIFLELYRDLDTWIGRFRATMADADVLVFSGSGLGPNYSGWHLLPEVLEKIGVGPPQESTNGGLASALLPMRRWGASRIRKVEDAVSVSLIEFLKKAVPAAVWDRTTRRLLHAGNRWADSKAFAVPNDYSGAIRINLKGREPQGVVPAAGSAFSSAVPSSRRVADSTKATTPMVGRIRTFACARGKGFRCHYVPDAIVYHKGCKIGRGYVPLYEKYKTKHYFRLLMRHTNVLQQACWGTVVAVRGAFVLARLVLCGEGRIAVAQLSGARDALAGSRRPPDDPVKP